MERRASQRIAKPLANYQRARGIDWRVPKTVDADNANVRCLLMCPGGPFVIDVNIYIDDQPFRKKREQTILQAQETANARQKAAKEDAQSDNEQRSEDTLDDGAEADDSAEDGDEEIEPTESKTDKEEVGSSPPQIERLVRYIANQPDPVTSGEARWLLSQWTPGPVLLELRDGFAAERTSLAPIWTVLDGDVDGELAENEISEAEVLLMSADTNGDESIDVKELIQFVPKEAKNTLRSRGPLRLLVTLGDHTDWDDLHWDLSDYYALDGTSEGLPASSSLIEQLDTNNNGKWDDAETQRLSEVAPHLAISVRLGGRETGLSVDAATPEIKTLNPEFHATDNAVVISLGQCHLELAAAQQEQNGQSTTDQVGIGAVLDGYPIMRMLDQNNDRKLSMREIKSINACLSAFDEDKDGRVTSSELAIPVRMNITLGPHVDRMLATPAPPIFIPFSESEEDQPEAPRWFVTMDINKDGDLSRSEFLGTRDQFRELDANGDGLLSAKEAAQFNPEGD
ncbi:MAG: hypothetical protein KDB27_10485 [Planctomycetales bacterium]|nr:hypothetical protein [Planctomycetales bacterium]